MHGQVCPGVLRSQSWSEICWRLRCSSFHFLVGFSSLSYVGCDVVAIRCCCPVSLVLAQFGELVWTGQEYFFATLQYMRWAPYWIKLKPEDFKKQIGKLAEKYDALVVVVTLEDGFGVPQVKLVTGIKFLRILRKENLAPSVPEVLYFLVKKAKSMRKHLDRNRKNKIRSSVSSSLRTAFTALRGTADASSSCLPTGSTSLLRPRLVLVADPHKECDPNVSVRRIEASFRKRGNSGIP